MTARSEPSSTVEVAPLAAQYVQAGLFLIPVPSGRKGPTSPAWQLRENAVDTITKARKMRGGNIGLAHAWSRTAAVDFDDLSRALESSALAGVDLQALLDAPDAVKISSGRPNRTKLLYRLPEGTDPLPSIKLWDAALELRCASQDGLTVQDVLPPSIHPDTGVPYEWIGDWREIPEMPDDLLWFWLGELSARGNNPTTTPGAVGDDELWLAQPMPLGLDDEALRDMLAEFDPGTGYDEWLRVGMALHHETSGEQRGFALWNEWSALSDKYAGERDLRSHWRSFRSARANAVTARWLRKGADVAKARSRGAATIDPRLLTDVAKRITKESFETESGDRRLLFTQGLWYLHDETHYREASPDLIRQQVWEYLEGSLKLDRNGLPVPVSPNITLVNNVVDALKALVYVDEKEPPSWLSGDTPVPATDLVPVQNGLLHIPTRKVLPHTPDYFALNALPFNWQSEATCPNWTEFLHTIWPDEPDSIETLQEMFGYLVTPDTRMQKAFMILGPKRSGKGTIARILRALLGHDNVVSPQLSQLSTNFGLQPLIGKLLAVIPDARISSKADIQAIVEKLLMITGEDAMTIDRKNKTAWSGSLTSRVLLMSNQMPMLVDASGAVASRMVVLQMRESFFGREDIGLIDRLLPELPGILRWALEGRARLYDRGRFEQPEGGASAVEALHEGASPVATFVDDCCELGSDYTAGRSELYSAWMRWCGGEGLHPGAANSFGRQLRAAFTTIGDRRYRHPDGRRERHYTGVQLRPGMESEFGDD